MTPVSFALTSVLLHTRQQMHAAILLLAYNHSPGRMLHVAVVRYSAHALRVTGEIPTVSFAPVKHRTQLNSDYYLLRLVTWLLAAVPFLRAVCLPLLLPMYHALQ